MSISGTAAAAGAEVTPSQLVAAQPAPAPGGNDYPWQRASMNGMSPLRFAYRNCTDYVAFQINKQLGGSLSDVRFDWASINAAGNGNASGWAKGAAGKYMVDQTPILGSIAWWGSARAGGYGHVGLVTGVGEGGNTISIDEYNTDMAGSFNGGHQLSRGQAGWPQGFIHVADIYADNTFLETDQARVYQVVGGAALPVPDWQHVGGQKPTVRVMQKQVDTMPTVPRDGSYLQDYVTGTEYVATNGKLQPLQKKTTTDMTYGQDLGAWAAGYVTPGRTTNGSPVKLHNADAPTADAATAAIMVDIPALGDMVAKQEPPKPITRLTLQ